MVLILLFIGLVQTFECQLRGTAIGAIALKVSMRPIFLHIGVMIFAASWCIWGFVTEGKIQRTAITPGSIREALDNLPSGLCLGTKEGLIVLANRKMNTLVLEITGKPLINTNMLWQDREGFRQTEKVYRIDYAGNHAFVLPNRSVWSFAIDEIEADQRSYIQITAVELTHYWAMYKDLEKDTIHLDAQQQRLKKLLQNMETISLLM